MDCPKGCGEMRIERSIRGFMLFYFCPVCHMTVTPVNNKDEKK